MPVRSEALDSHRLVDAESGALVVVLFIPAVLPPPPGGRVRPRLGEVLHCIGNSPDGTLVARPDGSRIVVDPTLGASIWVRNFWGPVRRWHSQEVGTLTL